MDSATVQSLFASAVKAMQNAIAPCSAFRVGAAILSGDGKIYTGCNIENPSLMLTTCAERVALLKALSEGCTSFKAIAVLCESGQYCFPCGSCRQMLSEFAPGIEIFLKSAGGVKKSTIEELLPHPFKQDLS